MWVRVIRPGYLVCAAVFAGLALAFGGPVAIGGLWLWLLLGAVDFVWGLVVGAQTTGFCGFEPGSYTAGDPIATALDVTNDGWLAAPAVTLRDGRQAVLPLVGAGRSERYSLPPQSRLEVRRTVTARRGQYRLGPVEVGTEGPFGIFSWCRLLYSEHGLTVLPRLRPLPHWPLEQAEAYGRAVRGHSPYPDPTVLVSTRPMLPGDSPRRIHWKRTARTGTLQVREVEPAAGGHGLLVLDLWAGAYGRRAGAELLDAATEIAASIGHAILRSGASLSFAPTGLRPAGLRRVRGPAALGQLLDLLAAAEADGAQPLRQRLPALAGEAGPRSLVVVVTPAPPGAWAAALPELRARGATVAAVLVVPRGAADTAAPAAERALRQLGTPAWAAVSAEQLAARLWPSGAGTWGRRALGAGAAGPDGS